MKKFVTVGIMSGLVLFSGCDILQNSESINSEDNLENNDMNKSVEFAKYPIVEVVQATRNSITPKITLTGTITTKDEITIASEVTGTVQKVSKKEGDVVSAGKTLMSLESSTNLLRASYSSASIALSNAKKGLVLAKKSAKQNLKDADLQINNAHLALKNAEIAYNRVKNSVKFKKNSNSASKESSDKMLEIAEKNLEIAKKGLSDLLEMTDQTHLRYLDSISSSVSSTLILLRSHLDFVDSLIGASEFREHDNDSFEVYLAGVSGNLIQEIQQNWRIINIELKKFDDNFSKIAKVQYNISDKEILLPFLSDSLQKAETVKKMLRDMETMLNASISSSTFPESKIESLKTQVTQFQSSLEGQIQSLKILRQSFTDFEIQNSQKIAEAELRITVRESEVLAQKSQNVVAESSEGSTEVAINSELESAKNGYLNAKNAVEFAKSQKVSVSIQGDLAIQSAVAQMDASRSMLDQAALSLSKLTISSGINGTVSKVLAFAGDTVSPGTPLMIISNYSELKLVSDVSLEDSFLLKKGMKAEVSIDGVQKIFKGKVSVIYPEADKITRRVRVEILIPNKEKIPANVFATASIILERQKPEVYVEKSLLVSSNPPTILIAKRKKCEKSSKKCISIYENQNIYIVKTQELEFKNEEETEFGFPVLKGLRRNEYILKNKLNNIFDGDEIFIKKEETENRDEKSENNKNGNKNNSDEKTLNI